MTLSIPSTVIRELKHLVLLSPSRFPVRVIFEEVPEDLFPSKAVKVGPSIYRKFICEDLCSVCCRSFGPLTLDYLPIESEWLKLDPQTQSMFEEKSIWVDETKKVFYSLVKSKEYCPLASSRGCSVWPRNPLACAASARIQISKYLETTMILKKGFSREWRWAERAQCEYLDILEWDASELGKDLQILDRYEAWAKYFNIPTIVSEICTNLTASYLLEKIIPFQCNFEE